MKRVAVILSGCGVYDGSEIHEATAVLLALDRAGAEAVICAPNTPQMHVIDHVTGEPAAGETRNTLVEAARIARGNIKELTRVQAGDLDAVLLPGGFGAAKNLCNFATEGEACRVNDEVASFLQTAHAAGKPIGAICIAPVILAKVFGADKRIELTIGNDAATAAAINAMGGVHVDRQVMEIAIDAENKIVTTPAYMLTERISEVFDGIEILVKQVLTMC
ncbi:MAG: isoprenoid biosynthesis glyoxalase ElbB [bacterium]